MEDNQSRKNELIREIGDLIDLESDNELNSFVQRFASDGVDNQTDYSPVIKSIRQISRHLGKDIATKIAKNTFSAMYGAKNDQ